MSDESDAHSSSAVPVSGGVAPQPLFLTTHWSVVLTAGREDTSRAEDALGRLCQVYWYPLYAYVRRRGFSPHDAEDLTQEFFARLLRKNYLADVQREKGKFRSFLLAAMNHFLASEWDRVRAMKRGGGRAPISLDAEAAENRYRLEPADNATAERIYDRRWALTLLNEVLVKLERDHLANGKEKLFAELRFCLTGERSQLPYSELASRLGMTEGAVKVAVHRLRQQYREALRAEIANTVSTREEIEEEIRCLFAALGT